MKIGPRLLIFELPDCKEYLGGMILAFFKYCYFWIDILGFLTQTFEPAPRMFSYGVPPWSKSTFFFISKKGP